MCSCRKCFTGVSLQSWKENICNTVWWKKFRLINLSKIYKMASSAANVKPESLPPNRTSCHVSYIPGILSTSLKEHTHGKYFRPKRWRVQIRRCLVGTSYERSRTYPDELLKVIRCNCQATAKNLFHGKQFFCLSNGLKYVAACGGCRGTECQNCVTVVLFEEEENTIEDEFDNIFDNVFG